MVPANSVELTFRKPDSIAEMDEEEIKEKCRYNNDLFIYENEYFYIRCILPLPVQGNEDGYCLGVWAQVSETHGF